MGRGVGEEEVCYGSLPQWGFWERLSLHSLWHIEWYWLCTIFRGMEKSFKSYIVFCASDEPKEHVGVSVCDVGWVRLRNEFCKHLCNYFPLCSSSIQLHKLFLYRTHSSHIFPVMLGSSVTSKFKYLQFNKGKKVWKELEQNHFMITSNFIWFLCF